MFSRNVYIHTLLCKDILKIHHSPDVLSKTLSCSSSLNLYFQSSYLLMKGKAHKPKHSSRVCPQRLCNPASLHGHVFPNLGRDSKIRLAKWAQKSLRKPEHSDPAFCWVTGLERNGIYMQNQRDNARLSFFFFLKSVSLTWTILLLFEDKATEITAAFIQIYS